MQPPPPPPPPPLRGSVLFCNMFLKFILILFSVVFMYLSSNFSYSIVISIYLYFLPLYFNVFPLICNY